MSGLAELGIRANPTALQRFGTLFNLLQEGNARMNLTALRTEQDVIIKHFVDSASCLIGGHLGGAGRMIDIGTGAGFPALPLAILDPRRPITALDSIRKKVDFVRRTAAALHLDDVLPLVGRAEALGRDPDFREGYDRVVMRAVATLPVIVELALPLLGLGGVLVAQKGPLSAQEVAAGTRAAEELGGQIIATERFKLPILGDSRTLIVVKKIGATPGRYPRREGVPTQQPLFWRAK